MFEFHTDKSRYFEMQRQIAAEYVVPMLELHLPDSRPWRVLEVGCAEAGVLKAFLDAGHHGVGIELEPRRAALAKGFLAQEIKDAKVQIVTADIYEVDPFELCETGFDAIVLKDVIEHIPEQERMIPRLAEFLAPGGKIFFGFPPWMMPFGGHQQIARSAWVSKIPWLHLLPRPLYAAWIKLFGEREHIQNELAFIRETRITIERFERIVKQSELRITDSQLWLFNPIYALKFGIGARPQLPFVAGVPWVRNFVTTAAYYVISKSNTSSGVGLSAKQHANALV